MHRLSAALVLLVVATVQTTPLLTPPAAAQTGQTDGAGDASSGTTIPEPAPEAPPPEPGTARPQYFTSPPIVPGERYDHNYPDPFILRVGSQYYAYATSTGGKNLPVLRSTNLFDWYPVGSGEAMPTPPSWAIADPIRGQLWGPSVVAIGGRYVAYSAWEIAPGRRCIAAAAGPTPAGPFVDRGSPLQCDWDPAGSIDPEPFINTDGQPYLLWKSQGEVGRTPTSLWSRQLSRDGLSFAPTWPTKLLTTELGWEQPVIENPSMVVWQGVHYLVYSAGLWESANYAMGVARCVGPAGPCIRSRDSPLIPNGPTQWGAGGGSFFLDTAGRLRLAYHAWNPPYSTNPQDPNCDGFLLCGSQGRRALLIAFLGTQGPTLEVRSSNPFGNVDAIRAIGDGKVVVAGWSIDPDTTAAVRMHVYANGRFVRATTANVNRPDVGRAFPQFGSNHGFDVTIDDLPAGPTEVCAFAINLNWGTTNPRLGCTTVSVTDNSPRGNVDLVRWNGPGQARVAGWAIDPDTSEPIRTHIYVNGRFVRATTANLNRPDVGRAFPGFGDDHGYDLTLTGLTAGRNEICVYGINVGRGNNALLACRGFTVPGGLPIGNVDLAQPQGPAQARLAGWAIDPDTREPIRAHIYVNGRFVRATTANLNRPDVGRAFPGFGDDHGYDLTLTGLAAGRNEICVYGINTGPGGNPLLACRTVTVTGAGTTPTTEDPQSNLPATPSTLPPPTGSLPPATTTDPSTTTLAPPTSPAWTPPG